MTTLTVTERGQVTLRKDVLKHLGIQPGDKITLDLLPGGRAELSVEKRKHTWDELVGLLDDKTNVHLTIDEINEAIAESYVAAGMQGMERE